MEGSNLIWESTVRRVRVISDPHSPSSLWLQLLLFSVEVLLRLPLPTRRYSMPLPHASREARTFATPPGVVPRAVTADCQWDVEGAWRIEVRTYRHSGYL